MQDMQRLNIVRIATGAVLLVVLSGTVLNGSGLFDPAISTDMKTRHLIMQVPSIFFIAAIWMVGRAFHAIAAGEAVEQALANLLQRLGLCLFLGGLSFVFLQPLLLRGLTSASSGWVWFDVPAMTLGCLGLMLVFLSAPFRDAAAARAELAEIL